MKLNLEFNQFNRNSKLNLKLEIRKLKVWYNLINN